MTDTPVSISANDLQASANAAWEKVVDKILALLQAQIAETASGGFFETFFSIWDHSLSESKDRIGNPQGDFLNEEDAENLWLMLFARLKDSGLRIRHSTDSLEGANAVVFYWGTAEQCGMSRKEFACLRVL